MSLVSRLYRLLRAEVGGHLPHKGSKPAAKTHSQDTYSDTNTTDSQAADDQQQEAQASYDLRLASYYTALELPYGADLNAVKQAHRRLIKQYHPDRFYDDASKQHTAGEVTRRLNEAYQELCDYLETI